MHVHLGLECRVGATHSSNRPSATWSNLETYPLRRTLSFQRTVSRLNYDTALTVEANQVGGRSSTEARLPEVGPVKQNSPLPVLGNLQGGTCWPLFCLKWASVEAGRQTRSTANHLRAHTWMLKWW